MKTYFEIFGIQPSPILLNGFDGRLKKAAFFQYKMRGQDAGGQCLDEFDRAYLAGYLYNSLIVNHDDDACLFTKTSKKRCYVYIGSKRYSPSRVAALAAGRTLYPSVRIVTKCGNGSCTNPAHLLIDLSESEDFESIQDLFDVPAVNIPQPAGFFSRLLVAQGSRRIPGIPLTTEDRSHIAFRIAKNCTHTLTDCLVPNTENADRFIVYETHDKKGKSIQFSLRKASLLAAGQAPDRRKMSTVTCGNLKCINPHHITSLSRIEFTSYISDLVKRKRHSPETRKVLNHLPTHVIESIKSRADASVRELCEELSVGRTSVWKYRRTASPNNMFAQLGARASVYSERPE